MKRRNVLLLGTGVVAAAVAARFALSSPESAVVKVVYKRLDYLRMEPQGVQRFARDLVSRSIVSASRLRAIDSTGALYTAPAMSAHNALNDGIHHGEDRVTSLYLISSDFFIYGADTSREVQYLGYYDPSLACRNPFAKLAMS